jgi:hypothetical protein
MDEEDLQAIAAGVTDWMGRMALATADLVRKSVTPIVTRHGGGPPRQHGTGTLFRIADRSFLVTASHVWNSPIKKDDLDYYVLTADNPASEVHLGGSNLHELRDPQDVAVIEMSPEVVADLADRRFLSLQYVDFALPRSGWFWVCGFPTHFAQQIAGEDSYRLQPFGLGGPHYTGSTALEGYRPEFHLLVRRDRDHLVHMDGSEGEDIDPLGGISGCSIWRSARDISEIGSWTPDDVKVVAVETHSYPKAIRGTYWREVGMVFWKTFPELRPHLILNGFSHPAI